MSTKDEYSLKTIQTKIGYLLVIGYCVAMLGACSHQTVLPSVDFGSCFMSYKKKSDLSQKLEQLKKSINLDDPNPSIMAVVGCMSYQMDQHEEANKWLKKAYDIAKDKNNAKHIAASALGLIYLKQQQITLIEPYTNAAKKHHLGRWMLILYHIFSYRTYKNAEHLHSAIKYMKHKHVAEESTSATNRMLDQMKLIYSIEQACENDEIPDIPDTVETTNTPKALNTAIIPANTTPEQKTTTTLDGQNTASTIVASSSPPPLASPVQCNKSNLEEEKNYLFSTSWGFLTALLKEPPLFNY